MNKFKINSTKKISPGFKIPEGYFENFSDTITLDFSPSQPKLILLSKRKWIISIAASIIILLSIPIYTKYNNNLNEIDDKTLESYIIYNSTINQDDIVNLLDNNDLSDIKIDFNIDNEDVENELNLGGNNNIEYYLYE